MGLTVSPCFKNNGFKRSLGLRFRNQNCAQHINKDLKISEGFEPPLGAFPEATVALMMEVWRGALDLSRRQQCACLIQEIGSRLSTTQVVINAALCYMHYFYEVFSPEMIKPVMVSIASLYLACKTEDFSRRLSLLISAAYGVFKKEVPHEYSPTFRRIVQNIHALEGTILMVVGFQKMDVKHPHVILINVLRQNDFPKHVSHTSYFVCTHILHFTTLLLRHSMEAIAATSLYVAAKWNNYDIKSEDGKWYQLFSPDLTQEEIIRMADEFTQAFHTCDVKIKNQVKNTLKMNFTRHHAREDPSLHGRRISEAPRAYNRSEKRPFEPQSTSQHQHAIKDIFPPNSGAYPSNQQQSAAANGAGHEDSRTRTKIPRVCSPKSQPPPHIHNQSTFHLPAHPDSASAFKRDIVQSHPDSVGASFSAVSSSRSSTTSVAKNDLSSIF